MYTSYHFKSAAEINPDILEAIKTTFKGKAVVITVEEEFDETAFLSSDPVNKKILLDSIAQDKNGDSVTVKVA